MIDTAKESKSLRVKFSDWAEIYHFVERQI